MPAQRKRILVPRGQIANAEHANQGLQLVGQRHHRAGVVARKQVTGKARFVMVFNGNRHTVAQAVVPRVVAAHGALQLGELAHHVGQQIRLGQARGLRHLAGQHRELVLRLHSEGQLRQAQLFDDARRNRGHTLRPLALRAQLVVVHHFTQSRHARFERLLAVFVKEKFGIGQTRAHHTFVALHHRTGIRRADVADHEEFVGEFADGIQQGKVLLVGLHGQDQALLRHIEELFFKFAD